MFDDVVELAARLRTRRTEACWTAVEGSLHPALVALIDHILALPTPPTQGRVLTATHAVDRAACDRAVATVAAHALLGRAARLLQPDEWIGDDLLDAILGASVEPDGETALTELIAHEAASRLSTAALPRDLAASCRRWLPCFIEMARLASAPAPRLRHLAG